MQGQLDSPLTERGRLQAVRAGERLGLESFDRLYASDLGRVRATVRAMDLPDELLNRACWVEGLRERGLGEWQGMTRQEIGLQHIAEAGAVPPGGETMESFSNRVVEALEPLGERHPGESLLVVSHGGVLAIWVKHVLGLQPTSPRRFGIQNVAFNRFRWTGEYWEIDVLGDETHLEGVESAPVSFADGVESPDGARSGTGS